jgi:hypothetical protein
VGDFNPHEQALECVHRKETGTPLKNKGASERLIAPSSDECEVIEDYIARNREDVTDEHGREPLITPVTVASASPQSSGTCTVSRDLVCTTVSVPTTGSQRSVRPLRTVTRRQRAPQV